MCNYIGAQPVYSSAYILPTYCEEDREDNLAVDLQETDPLFEETIKLIALHQQGNYFLDSTQAEDRL